MMFFKKIIKKIFVRFAFSGYPKIVIASTGRAGSTMLFNAIADSLIQNRFHLQPDSRISHIFKRLITGYVDRINTLPYESCLICKTHDLYVDEINSHDKFVFVYGDPLDSAMSVEQVVNIEGLDWFSLHQYHLDASGSFSDLYEKDVLNYEAQIDNWMGHLRDNVFCVDYDDIWEESEQLSKFLSVKINLPARRRRQSKPGKSNINEQMFTYLRQLKDKKKQSYLAARMTRN